MEMFGLLLSVGVIDETLREAGRASFPLEDVLVADLLQEPQLNVDETSWPENRLLLWLWALVTPWTVLFVIGPRHAEMLENVLQDGYYGILISDGYRVYRAWLNRLRCWPHLIRKLRGLAESSDGRVSGVGQEMEGLMHTLEDAIYAAQCITRYWLSFVGGGRSVTMMASFSSPLKFAISAKLVFALGKFLSEYSSSVTISCLIFSGSKATQESPTG
jgi:hypothetical protein